MGGKEGGVYITQILTRRNVPRDRGFRGTDNYVLEVTAKKNTLPRHIALATCLQLH